MGVEVLQSLISENCNYLTCPQFPEKSYSQGVSFDPTYSSPSENSLFPGQICQKQSTTLFNITAAEVGKSENKQQTNQRT